ncbi:cytochrome-c oxidase, cbb3-type subunit III [Halocynthiibacter styelae]|uniref:Cbb3-type cytochrome c oxidase subunit n=1 Tax=Halocynthiibacter styelae TaxID=2761955 RepID=A0A8J7IEZ4_9RHOB|nr:cytochrome-c oxidase, cbb3-type subunit III [Paenihalocynthiibacter styelae]MBI1494322.1 cytochrome-c oxidase, cbb3-type subunit III [Paenihalocynthiibacter styelae]
MAANKHDKEDHEYGTTGHEWDGIQEWNNPLPRWWLWSFYLCIIWGIGYVIAYPAWPLINGATPGLLGYSTRAEVAEEIERFDVANAPMEALLNETPLADVEQNPELNDFAKNAGQAVYNTWCVQCHQAGGAGAKGYPVLVDNDWLWGGTIDDIYLTVNHGIRTEDDMDTRYSQMPAYGDFMSDEEISSLVAYVQTISGQDADTTLAETGSQLFYDNCAACHGDAGTGDIFQGAPDLTDRIWLFGGDEAALTETITNARFGVMPSWSARGMSEADIRAVSLYVHQLGGGE